MDVKSRISFESSLKYDSKEESRQLDDYVLDETVRHINDASTILKCSIRTRVKALLIYHYFRRCVHETKYDSYMVAAACISLSIKYNEDAVEFDTIMLIFFRILDQGAHRSTESLEFQKLKQSVTFIECLILRMLEFSLNHIIAHEYLEYFIYDIREELTSYNVWNVFSETCIKLASDFYLFNKCLNYKAEEIAASIIKVSLYLLGVDINIDSCHLKIWLKTLSDCDEDITNEIIEDIFRICDIGSYVESNI